MKFGKWITNTHVEPISHKKPWLSKKFGYFEFDRRATDLEDEGGLVAFRKKFTKKNAGKLYLRITALGVFEVYLNGVRIGHMLENGVVYDEMKPGWTEYRKHVFEFEYDITSLCLKGENTLVVCVANGWWSGRISNGVCGYSRCGVCCEIVNENDTAVLASDETWETAQGGRVRAADIWDGELYDGREPDITAETEVFSWENVSLYDGISCDIVPHIGETVRLKRENISPVSAVVFDGICDNGTDCGEVCVVSRCEGENCDKISLKKGQHLLLDMGYNHTGRPSLCFSAARGVTLRVYCAEMLNDSGSRARGNDGAKGSVYIENYRSALSRIQIISGGGRTEYTPLYTFYGYRYLELVADGDVEIESVKTNVIGSDIQRTGWIKTDNREINMLIDNIFRGMESNYLSVPTDCPQRDERLGWTGDTQLFCGAASYFASVGQFLRKWMMDMRDSQTPEGAFAFLAPRVFENCDFAKQDGCSAWSDAGIIVPYRMWLMYGDEGIVRENFEAMEAYMRFIENDAACGIRGPKPTFGDWLAYEETPKPFVSVCYYAYDALLMEKMSHALGKEDRADYYAALRQKILAYFREKYMENGEITVKTQTAYILPLAFDMLTGDERDLAITLLKAKIKDNDYTLSTGFLGTGLINSTLSRVGLDAEAYSLLLQTRDPSWLYSVLQGATTVWERWNSYNLDRGFGEVSMNSFNHYAYGAVAEWMFAYMAGIRPCEDAVGFRRVILAPRPDLRREEEMPEGQKPIRSVAAEYQSAAGRIGASWHVEDGVFTYRITVPDGVTAIVEFPLIYGDCDVLVNRKPVAYERRGDCAVFALSAGTYVIIDEKTKRRSLRCRLAPYQTLPDPKFVVVCTRCDGKWVLSRHKSRDTWESQGGHIEEGESPIQAAARELFEESGIRDAVLYPVCDYVGYDDFGSANGVVFLAEVRSLGALPESEMKEIRLFEELPCELTYPKVTPILFAKAQAVGLPLPKVFNK